MKTKHFYGMIFLFAAAVLQLSGCSSGKGAVGLDMEKLQDIRQAMESAIPEADRRRAMLTLVDRFETDADKMHAEAQLLHERLLEANRDYRTSREDMQQLYDEQRILTERMGNLVRDTSLELRTLCSEDEWSRIFK